MMKKRILTMVTALAVLCSSALPWVGAEAAAQETSGTTYYVSTLHGKDSNDGKTEKTPFYSLQKIGSLDLKPGDQILLESGSVFTNGYLHLYEQSGSKEAPIVIDKYGKGAAPVINTNGQGIWYQNYGTQLGNPNHKYQGYVSSSILLYDTEYIEIKNLEIVNKALPVDTGYNTMASMNRTGVAAVAQNKGTIDHIYLNGLNIHDVQGNVYDKHMNNGGIYFSVFLPRNAAEKETNISRYNDVKIENCRLEKVNRWGITVGYTAYCSKFGAKAIEDSLIQKYGSTNVVIRNNYIKEAGGDAITTMYCHRPLIEYNVADSVAAQINNTDYAETTFGKVAAAIWPWKCKDAVFQYNEVFDTQNGAEGNDDAQAWDADWGDGTLYQYNYSHHNTGGCVMFCLSDAYQTTFRYNISQNDLKGALDITGNPDAHVYNNVFYMAEGVPFIRDGREAYGPATIENNIIYNAGSAPRKEVWNKNHKQVYSNNLYYNYTNVPESDSAAVSVKAGTEVFVKAGSGPSATTGKANPHSKPGVTTAFDGYQLVKGSPAIGKGKKITDANGKEASQVDFFGNSLKDVTAFDIGAHQYREIKGDSGKPAADSGAETEKEAPGPVQASLTLDKTEAVIYTKGEKTVTLKAAAPGLSGTVSWTSAKPQTATVKNGKVIAKKAGETVITAELGGRKASCVVTVKKPTLKLKKKKLAVKKGKKAKILTTAVPAGKRTFKSSDARVASVDKKGAVKGRKAGICKITVTCNGLKKTVKVKVK